MGRTSARRERKTKGCRIKPYSQRVITLVAKRVTKEKWILLGQIQPFRCTITNLGHVHHKRDSPHTSGKGTLIGSEKNKTPKTEVSKGMNKGGRRERSKALLPERKRGF